MCNRCQNIGRELWLTCAQVAASREVLLGKEDLPKYATTPVGYAFRAGTGLEIENLVPWLTRRKFLANVVNFYDVSRVKTNLVPLSEAPVCNRRIQQYAGVKVMLVDIRNDDPHSFRIAIFSGTLFMSEPKDQFATLTED